MQTLVARLDVPWPTAIAEAPRACYEGKTLPLTIPGAFALDCEAMERWGLLRLTPMELLIAAHLHPSVSDAPTYTRVSVMSKPDRLQSALTEGGYKAAALAARALNVLSLLTAYQLSCRTTARHVNKRCGTKFPSKPCLRVQHCTVQAMGKVMGTLVLHERARWHNLANLPDREKDNVMDMPIDQEGIFGFALASVQQR